MHRDLLELKKELNAILSRDPALRQALHEANKTDMIRASLIMRNSKHEEIPVDRIMAGELIREVSVGDYTFIQNYTELMRMVYNYLEMGNSVNRNLLVAAYRILAEDPEADTRKDNPVVYSTNHVPVSWEEIDNRLTKAFNRIYGSEMAGDVVACAMYMLNSIMDIWPFDDFSGELAVFAMNYYLMEKGFMPIDMPMSQREFLDLITACLKGRRPDEEYEFLRGAIKEKMIRTVEVCRGISNED